MMMRVAAAKAWSTGKSSTRRPTVYGPGMDPARRSASMSLRADRGAARQAPAGNSATNPLLPITDQPATRQSASCALLSLPPLPPLPPVSRPSSWILPIPLRSGTLSPSRKMRCPHSSSVGHPAASSGAAGQRNRTTRTALEDPPEHRMTQDRLTIAMIRCLSLRILPKWPPQHRAFVDKPRVVLPL